MQDLCSDHPSILNFEMSALRLRQAAEHVFTIEKRGQPNLSRLEEFAGSPAADAVIIGCAQALEHYEIARYGKMKTWAGLLGMKQAASLFDQTLKEEKKADALLSVLAKQVNAKAAWA